MRTQARDPFGWWYSLQTVAKRTGKSARTIRRAMLSGQFGPAPGQPGCLLRHICGEWLFPWPAVCLFLKIPPGEGEESDAWRVRTEGELRRELAREAGAVAVHASGRKEAAA
jgi:hypothetical protein